MASVNFEQIFDRALPIANNVMLTVTQAPEREQDLLEMLERAMMRGMRERAQLTQIHVPFERFPFMDSKFWHIPVEDSGDTGVLRFFFETPDLEAA
ncbi:MAG: hypothetical protein WAK03_04085 [Methylocystis sp.]|jgi:hypothetical protein